MAIDVAGERRPAQELDAERLTREDEITSTVHYLKFSFTPDAAAPRSRTARCASSIDHPEYQADVDARPTTQRDELVGDFAA